MMTAIILLVLINNLIPIRAMIREHIPEEGRMNFTQLGVKYGHSVKEHEVVTEDGYVLRLFQIPGKRKTPVLVMHGLIDSADAWIVRGKTSIAVSLADAGYDVWAGNLRGNKYSRRHLTLNPDEDVKFWDYSFHEGGYYDLPAMIDYILQTTGEKKLQTIGHSQGTTMHFVLLSKRPEYNEKIKLFIALAPAAFFTDLTPPLSYISLFTRMIDDAFKSRAVEEFFPSNSSFTSFVRAMCTQEVLSYELCIQVIASSLAGRDKKRLEPGFLKILIGHAPSSTSRKSVLHFGQLVMSKRFCSFDYGAMENLKRYGYIVPPDYNVRQITAKVAVFVSRNDLLSRIKDVEILRTLLPNIVYYHVMKSKTWNHIDFTLANDLTVTLLPYIFQLLDKYE